MLSRSDSERQRNLMIHDQCPLPVYFSQVLLKHLLVLLTHVLAYAFMIGTIVLYVNQRVQ